MRLTKHRKEVLDTLTGNKQALSATEIYTLLPHINLVTIYRTLDYFVGEGVIKKLHLNETEARYEKQEAPHHHAICTNCERIIHFTLDDKVLADQLKFSDFSISNIEVTVNGHCKNSH